MRQLSLLHASDTEENEHCEVAYCSTLQSPRSFTQVDAYFRYQSVVGFDCAKACLEVALWKRRTLAEVRLQIRNNLRLAIFG